MNDARPNNVRCQALRSDGQPCRANATLNSRCVGHQPGVQDARRRGGAATSRAARANRLLPARLRPVAVLLEQALVETHDGKLSPRVASAMAAVAGALVRVVTSGEMEERVRSLEERLVRGDESRMPPTG